MPRYVHRVAGAIASAHVEIQPGYAEELLQDNDPELVAHLAPWVPPDLSNIDNLDRALRAFALMVRDYTNALQAGTHTQKTIAQLRADFATKYNGLQ